jgi:hypothetical protein
MLLDLYFSPTTCVSSERDLPGFSAAERLMILDLYFSPTTSQASHGEIFFFWDDLGRCALLGKTIQGMDGGVFLCCCCFRRSLLVRISRGRVMMMILGLYFSPTIAEHSRSPANSVSDNGHGHGTVVAHSIPSMFSPW